MASRLRLFILLLLAAACGSDDDMGMGNESGGGDPPPRVQDTTKHIKFVSKYSGITTESWQGLRKVLEDNKVEPSIPSFKVVLCDEISGFVDRDPFCLFDTTINVSSRCYTLFIEANISRGSFERYYHGKTFWNDLTDREIKDFFDSIYVSIGRAAYGSEDKGAFVRGGCIGVEFVVRCYDLYGYRDFTLCYPSY